MARKISAFDSEFLVSAFRTAVLKEKIPEDQWREYAAQTVRDFTGSATVDQCGKCLLCVCASVSCIQFQPLVSWLLMPVDLSQVAPIDWLTASRAGNRHDPPHASRARRVACRRSAAPGLRVWSLLCRQCVRSVGQACPIVAVLADHLAHLLRPDVVLQSEKVHLIIIVRRYLVSGNRQDRPLRTVQAPLVCFYEDADHKRRSRKGEKGPSCDGAWLLQGRPWCFRYFPRRVDGSRERRRLLRY